MRRARESPTPLHAGMAMLFVAFAAIASPVHADHDDVPKDPWKLKLFRFEFDNDTFLGSDDAFTAGWSFQVHSRLMDTWDPFYAGWIGKVPGLGDDGEGRRVSRWAYGLTQIIVTPHDVSIAEPQPNDAPWAGILGMYGSFYSYNNRRLAALQLYLGCMGPCSQAEEVQTFIHDDLGFGTPPEGWDNQLVNQALGNVNYEYRYKLWADADEAYVPGRFAQDFAVVSQVGLGNFATFVNASIDYRFGWGLPQGFTKTADPPAFGIAMDPVYVTPGVPFPADFGHWRTYFNVVARAAHIEHFEPAEGGETVNGGEHPGLPEIPGKYMGLLGIHVAKVRGGFHLTYYRYFDTVEGGSGGSLDWINLSFEYRF
jgi:outer membrane protein LpxR